MSFSQEKGCKVWFNHFHSAYKKARNNLNKLVKNTKADYCNNAISQCRKDPKSIWNTVNKLTNSKSKTSNINELVVDHEVLTKPGEMADAMNKYFNEIGSVLADKLSQATFEIQKISVTAGIAEDR